MELQDVNKLKKPIFKIKYATLRKLAFFEFTIILLLVVMLAQKCTYHCENDNMLEINAIEENHFIIRESKRNIDIYIVDTVEEQAE